MLRSPDRKKVRELRQELRRDGGLNREDRQQVRSLRHHLKARKLDRKARDPNPRGADRDLDRDEAPEEAEPTALRRPLVRPRSPKRLGPIRPGPLGPGARLRARRRGQDDDVDVVTEDEEAQEVVEELTGMLGEIAGLTSFSGRSPGLGAVLNGLYSQGYEAEDVVGALQDFGYELMDKVVEAGASIGATVGEAKEAAGPVVRAVKALGRGVKKVAQGAGRGVKKVASRVKARRQARREGLAQEREQTAADRAMKVNDTDVSPRSLLRDWSDFIAPPEMGMRFQVAAGKAVYVQPVDANKSIYVVTVAPNTMGSNTETVARAAGRALLQDGGMAAWKNLLDPLFIARVQSAQLAGPVLGCGGQRCLECEQGL